jgi:pimeloyl-ACP methyl ester carboxylesterase
MPVLAVGGEHSAGDRLAVALRQVAPQVQGVTIAGAGHFVTHEQPDSLLAALIPFFNERALGTAD